MIKTLFFDLDGTLCPLDQTLFVRRYMKAICRKAAEYGYAPDAFSDALWKGTYAMIANNGERSNCEVFWETAAKLLGSDVREKLDAELNDFYRNEFDEVREVMGERFPSAELIAQLKAKGYRLVLATNPMFPMTAVHTRLGWSGLKPEDFCRITSYENSSYCKPNLRYFQEILEKIGETPEHCMMIGNNLQEDMAAKKLGFSVYLITDYLENPDGACYNTLSHGTFREFMEFAAALPELTGKANG